MIYIIDKNGRIAYKAMWTDHEEVASVLANLVLADQTGRPGCEGKPSYTGKNQLHSSTICWRLREKVFDRAGPKAWEDYRKVFAGS
jgi:hypothetical protein